MNERLQKIADDLGTNVYKNALHGQIAKENFIYGVKQAEMEGEAFYTAEMLRKEKEEADHLREVKQMVVDKACEWLKNWMLSSKWHTMEESLEMLRKAMEEDEK